MVRTGSYAPDSECSSLFQYEVDGYLNGIIADLWREFFIASRNSILLLSVLILSIVKI